MTASYQTVTLARGKHTSPRSGACVMELASMLAGEPFSDRPAAVCPIVAAFLRAYNDAVDDAHRQDLYVYAAAAVGTRASWPLMRLRARLCLEELRALRRTPLGMLTAPRALPDSLPAMERLAGRAARELRRSGVEGHARALRLADDLIAPGAPAGLSSPWHDIDGGAVAARRTGVRVQQRG
jgi:hypothetical protein